MGSLRNETWLFDVSLILDANGKKVDFICSTRDDDVSLHIIIVKKCINFLPELDSRALVSYYLY